MWIEAYLIKEGDVIKGRKVVGIDPELHTIMVALDNGKHQPYSLLQFTNDELVEVERENRN